MERGVSYNTKMYEVMFEDVRKIISPPWNIIFALFKNFEDYSKPCFALIDKSKRTLI